MGASAIRMIDTRKSHGLASADVLKLHVNSRGGGHQGRFCSLFLQWKRRRLHRLHPAAFVPCVPDILFFFFVLFQPRVQLLIFPRLLTAAVSGEAMTEEELKESIQMPSTFFGAGGRLRGQSLRGLRVNFCSPQRVAGGSPADVEETGRKDFLYLLTTSSKRRFPPAELTGEAVRWFRRLARRQQSRQQGFRCTPAGDWGIRPAAYRWDQR